jgi:hypothetical protein
MRYDLLKDIAATDPLARLFNDYLKGLSTTAIVTNPTYTTMAEVRTLYDKTGKAKDRNHLRHCAQRHYELTVVRNTLHDLHSHVLGAITELEDFFAQYRGNLFQYALDNRVATLKEYGSDDDSDWYRDNEADENEEWKVAYKDDPETLRQYSLWDTLGRYFGRGDTRGEYIGTSTYSDFYPYTAFVAQQSVFSFRKMLEAATGKEPTIVRVGEDGSHTPMSLGDHLEDELNEDLAGEELERRFNIVLDVCCQLGTLYRTQLFDPGSPFIYEKLLECLRAVRDVETQPGQTLHNSY